MTDMSSVIVAKSDQWNAADFQSGPQTFTIRDVSVRPGTEQPVSIALLGTDKVYRPCKSMARVLVAAWGKDGKEYVGRSLTLYCDPGVKWAGMEVGGIRISHLSHITGAMKVPLAVSRESRKMFTVSPLVVNPALSLAREQAGFGTDTFREHWKRLSKPDQATLNPHLEELKAIAAKADAAMAGPPATDREPGDE